MVLLQLTDNRGLPATDDSYLPEEFNEMTRQVDVADHRRQLRLCTQDT